MNIAYNILPECFVDTAIVNALMKIEGCYVDPLHCYGCNKVGDMMKNKLGDEFALGIIDNDKRQHSYNNNFYLIGKSEHIELMKHKSKPQYLIRISPAMDGFILDVAKRNNINMSEYDLPDNLATFITITKNAKVKDNNNLKKIVKHLVDDKEMAILRGLLGYIYKNKYDCSEKDLLCYFE